MDTASLLTDEQVQEFLINGYLVLQPASLDKSFHSSVFTETLSIFQEDGNPGNNILPRVPQLQCVFDDPVVRGALESLLGSNYTMQPHRHAHLTKPGSQDQQWHKDSYFGYRKLLRHHQLRYIMAMYYPQDTTMEMGPTAIKPRSQYDVMDANTHRSEDLLENSNASSGTEDDVFMICTAGTVVLIHYDIFHRGTANVTSDSYRFMFKFQFNRLEEPTRPTWNHDSRNAAYDAVDAGLLQPIVKHIWTWMMGSISTLPQRPPDRDILEWERQLHEKDGKVRLNAAYNLALSNEYKTLVNRLYRGKGVFRLEAAYALTACRYSQSVINELQAILEKEQRSEHQTACIAFVLSEMGSMALETLPLLIRVIETTDSWLVKQYCCEALGTIQSDKHDDVDLIVRCLTRVLAKRDEGVDSKEASHIRFTAALSLAKIGVGAVGAIPALKDALHLDTNRYVNGNALLALERIGTSAALETVMCYLKTARWCTKTTASSLY